MDKINNKSTKVLHLITSPLNTKGKYGSEGYINKIHSIAKEYNVEVKEHKCDDQFAFDLFRTQEKGKFIIVTPTNIQAHGFDAVHNLDHYNHSRVVETVTEMITDPYETYINPYHEKIAILGRGEVGNGIYAKLRDNNYAVCQLNSNNEITPDFLANFSVLINCTASNQDEPPLNFFNGKKLFDVAGNFEQMSIITDDPVLGEVRMQAYDVETISCGEIGTIMIHKMLNDLVHME